MVRENSAEVFRSWRKKKKKLDYKRLKETGVRWGALEVEILSLQNFFILFFGER